MVDYPNVLLLVMDCVRARNTSLYEYGRETTPFLADFGSRSTVYEQARAPSPRSLTSHTSIFTGLHVGEHNVVSTDQRLTAGHTIWEELADEYSYRTGVFSENSFLTELDVGLKSAFDHVYSGQERPYPGGLDPIAYANGSDIDCLGYFLDSLRERTPVRSLLNGLAAVRSERTGRQYVDEFLAWRDEVTGPWAGVVNFMDAHTDYLPPAAHDMWGDDAAREIMNDLDQPVWEFQCGHRPYSELEQLEDLYDGCIHYVDAQIERLFNHLTNSGELKDTLVIITADHGDTFGEESRLRSGVRLAGHGDTKVHESVLHVPLVVKLPGQQAGERVTGPVSLTYLRSLIQATVEGGEPTERFTKAGPVLTTATGIPDVHKGDEQVSRYCESIDAFRGTARALYRQDGNAVEKYMTWGSESAAIEVNTPQNVIDLDRKDIAARVREQFQDLSDSGVAAVNDGDIDDAVYRHLKELGYA